MSNTSIIVNNLSVTLQGNDLLKNISFAVNAGEHLSIVGASGSGKTVLAKVLAGQMFAKGNIVIEFDAHSSLQKKVLLTEQRNQFKSLSHTTDFYYQQRYNSFDNSDAQTVMQELLQVNEKQSVEYVQRLVILFGLSKRCEAPLIQLSSGENKRFQLIKAVLFQPQILILDSPFTGLNAAARKQLHQTINVLTANGTKIILITDAFQVPDCITHVALLHNGALQSFITKEKFYPGDVSAETVHKYKNIYALPVHENEQHYESVVNMCDVTVQYENKIILRNINWQIKQGEKWLLKGHNGAGKSTLLSLINGDNPQAYKNEIYLFDKRRGSGESIWDIKKKIGFVSPELHAFYDKGTSCYNAVTSGFFDTIGLFRKPSAHQQEQVKQWIDFLDLSDVQNKPLSGLSFGTQRLILLARALVKIPPLLILDEPCQGLDDEQKDVFLNLVNNVCEQFNKTLIYVSHYDSEIPSCIRRVIELRNGKQRIYSRIKEVESI